MLCWLNRNKTLYDLIQWFPQVLEPHCMLESFGKLLKHHNAQAIPHSNQITISGSGWDIGMNFFMTSYTISYIEFVKTLPRYSKPSLGLFLKVCSSVNRSHILGTVLSTSFWACFLIYFPSPYWSTPHTSHLEVTSSLSLTWMPLHLKEVDTLSVCISRCLLTTHPGKITDKGSSFNKDSLSTFNSTGLNDLYFNPLINFVPLV